MITDDALYLAARERLTAFRKKYSSSYEADDEKPMLIETTFAGKQAVVVGEEHGSYLALDAYVMLCRGVQRTPQQWVFVREDWFPKSKKAQSLPKDASLEARFEAELAYDPLGGYLKQFAHAHRIPVENSAIQLHYCRENISRSTGLAERDIDFMQLYLELGGRVVEDVVHPHGDTESCVYLSQMFKQQQQYLVDIAREISLLPNNLPDAWIEKFEIITGAWNEQMRNVLTPKLARHVDRPYVLISCGEAHIGAFVTE